MAYPALSGWLAERRAAPKHANFQLTNVEKFVSSGKRIVRGIASSISVDRQGDVVVPQGGRWGLPLPLLWQHRHDEPIGWVRALQVRGDVLWMEAEVAEGIDHADRAWKMIESRLVDSFSIGFLGKKWEPLSNGGRRYTEWSLVEVSVVTVPANQDARISRSSERNAGSVSLARSRSSAGVPLKQVKPGVRLKRPAGAPIQLTTPEPVPFKRRPDGTVSLRRDR